MRKVSLLMMLMMLIATDSAWAESIAGRFGLTGKAGLMVPARDSFISNASISGNSEAETGFTGGGGFIYGIGSNVALEVEAMHTPNTDVELAGVKVFEASFTDLSLGLQYRFSPDNRLVPVLGAGADFIKGDLNSNTGVRYDLDWAVGGHADVGVDYFLTSGIAVSLNLRGIYTTRGNIKSGDTKIGKYDPMGFAGTVGIRLFLPEHVFY